MIISASRRTDLPACYPDWLFQRLKEEYVLVRNPMNAHQISRIDLSPKVVDGIVLWTKNPLPLFRHLNELEKYSYYVQFTLTPYGPEAEPGLPSKNRVMIPAFCRLSREIGRERVVWRYDPIFLSNVYTMEYHTKYFRVLASRLGEYTEKCTVSFLDLYQSTARNGRPLGIHTETGEQQLELMERFAEIAEEWGITIDTCAEQGDFGRFHVGRASCIDKDRLERISGCQLKVKKDPNQRPECGCAAGIDIGTYDTCRIGCLYCYANHHRDTVFKNSQRHNPASPLLFGEIGENDRIMERRMESCMDGQMSFHDWHG